ncbi:MAG: T9SS type A sorting domain-containing protein, partial [Aliifodinibius sp.]|nr:T9SS type A sorting domain-containing protein [Fodinibius sp.]NIY27501.1 T9SS type A sorting domain-containing protein [Fodinibius sp.]
MRDFAIAPIILEVTKLENQPTSIPVYTVEANILTLSPAHYVQNATIHYNPGGGWQEIPLMQINDTLYTGDIPQQPFGSIIRYYVSAEDERGLRRTFPANAETDSVFLCFGIYEPNTQTLDLDFEEGPGNVPVDSSDYGNRVQAIGNPTYSTNAAIGNYSIHLEGDSSYLEIDSPFMASPEFTVDFWFNLDSLEAFRRMISLGTSTGSSNYMVFLMPDSTLTAESSIENDPIGASGLRDELKLNTRINIGQWYHAIYQLSSDTVLLQLYDANDLLLDEKRLSIIGPATRLEGKFRIGLLYNHTGYFGGYVDEVKVYNYARDLTVGIEPEEKSGVPLRYELSQNYPNPFNAQTTIEYSLPVSGRVKITLYDILGRKVKTLFDEKKPAGPYKLRFDAG